MSDKELPWFKFKPANWIQGDITACDRIAQAIFIEICCIYWKKKGNYPFIIIRQRYSKDIASVKQLLDCGVLKASDSGKAVIDFLDEQIEARASLSQVRAEAGSKGGLANAKQMLSKEEAIPTEPEPELEPDNEKKESVKRPDTNIEKVIKEEPSDNIGNGNTSSSSIKTTVYEKKCSFLRKNLLGKKCKVVNKHDSPSITNAKIDTLIEGNNVDDLLKYYFYTRIYETKHQGKIDFGSYFLGAVSKKYSINDTVLDKIKTTIREI